MTDSFRKRAAQKYDRFDLCSSFILNGRCGGEQRRWNSSCGSWQTGDGAKPYAGPAATILVRKVSKWETLRVSQPFGASIEAFFGLKYSQGNFWINESEARGRIRVRDVGHGRTARRPAIGYRAVGQSLCVHCADRIGQLKNSQHENRQHKQVRDEVAYRNSFCLH